MKTDHWPDIDPTGRDNPCNQVSSLFFHSEKKRKQLLFEITFHIFSWVGYGEGEWKSGQVRRLISYM